MCSVTGKVARLEIQQFLMLSSNFKYIVKTSKLEKNTLEMMSKKNLTFIAEKI